jgi:hypothetical protein
MMNDILLIAGPEGHDDELVTAAAAHRPLRVTVLIDAHDPNWAWSDTRAATARRDRLARLLSTIERKTGAAVVGMVGDPVELRLDGFDAVVRAQGLLSAA